MKTIEQILELIKLNAYSGTTENIQAIVELVNEAQNQALRQPPVISCVCQNEIKTGTVAIHCCNLCGKPDEDWWGKHCL